MQPVSQSNTTQSNNQLINQSLLLTAPVNLPVVGGRDNGIPTSTISSKNVRAGSKKKSKSKKKKMKRELVYTRWGGNECRGEAKVVYTGWYQVETSLKRFCYDYY